MESYVETWRATSLHFFVFLRRNYDGMFKRFYFIILALLLVLGAKAQNDTVLFSVKGGFYENVFPLELHNTNPQNHIRFTTNGNCPTAQSLAYEGPLTLNASMFSKSNIYTIVNTIPSIFYQPDDVQRAIVIRAAVFDQNNNRVSQVVTHSYFIRSLGCDFHGLPVLSLSADSLSLFDYYTGIFVPGVNYDPADSTHTGNFKMKGREWEREINMEFYEPDNTGINQLCGLRTHGGASRWMQQKGLKLYAREEYGKKHFLFPFFKDSPFVKFKHLNLHSFRCSNWLQTGGTEYLAQKVASKLDVDAMAVREIVLFINGEYWGIYTMEESPDERYIEEHYNADVDSVVIIKYWGVPNYGDPTEWREYLSYMKEADLTQPEDSAFAYSHTDVPSFIDYILMETFSANLDWPGNNVKISQKGPGAPFRWMFYDGDGCYYRVNFQALQHILDLDVCNIVLSRFLENRDFRFQFCKRYEELSHTYFSYDYMKSVLEQYRHLVEREVESQYRRFHFPDSVDRWYEDMERTDAFLSQRDQYFREELKDYLDVEEMTLAMVSCYPNPFLDEIQISLKDGHYGSDEIVIYDAMGRRVFVQPCQLAEGENHFVIQPKLSSGLYLLRVGSYSQRILKY